MTKAPSRNRHAFTLVELLVVIGIIALLISILLPSLAKARKSANTVKCSANIRSILQGMQIYASQNNGAIPGNAWTTARFIYRDPLAGLLAVEYFDGNCPSVIAIFDWMSPIAKVMGIKFEEGGSLPERVKRWEYLRGIPAFTCPENEFLCAPFGSPTFTTGPMPSYNTALLFHLVRPPTNPNAGVVGRTISRPEQKLPSGYSPKTNKVGDGSRKIYIADGGRYSNGAISPDASLSYINSTGGAAGDQGPPFRFSNSWDRQNVPGNLPHPQAASVGPRDARIYAFRHGMNRQKGSADTFRFNCGFFDGHVETLGDLEGANPSFWAPKGTELLIDAAQVHPDVLKKYFNNQTYTLTRPFIVPW